FGIASPLFEADLLILRRILEEDAAGQGRDAYADKLGKLWTGCMDEKKAEDRGPLDRELATIAAIRDKKAFAQAIATAQRRAEAPLFGAGADANERDSRVEVLYVQQGGLGLPERDYYFDDPAHPDPRFAKTRAAYRARVAAMLGLVGESAEHAAKDADAI